MMIKTIITVWLIVALAILVYLKFYSDRNE